MYALTDRPAILHQHTLSKKILKNISEKILTKIDIPAVT